MDQALNTEFRARVLVVDDEHSIAGTLAIILAKSGFETAVAHVSPAEPEHCRPAASSSRYPLAGSTLIFVAVTNPAVKFRPIGLSLGRFADILCFRLKCLSDALGDCRAR